MCRLLKQLMCRIFVDVLVLKDNVFFEAEACLLEKFEKSKFSDEHPNEIKKVYGHQMKPATFTLEPN